MKRYLSYTFFFTFMLLLFVSARSAAAQGDTPTTAVNLPPLSLFTAYPAQTFSPEDSITIPFTVCVGSEAQVGYFCISPNIVY